MNRRYPGRDREAYLATTIMRMATTGALPSALLCAYCLWSGITEGVWLFAPLVLLWPVWFLLLQIDFPGIRIMAHLFILTTISSFNASIYLSDGLNSPFFAWQILTPLISVLLMSWWESLLWGVSMLCLLFSWYLFDFPSRNVLMVGVDPANARMVSYLLLFFTQLSALALLLSDRERIFSSQVQLEREMQEQQDALEGIRRGQMDERARLNGILEEDFTPMLAKIRSSQKSALRDIELEPEEQAVLQEGLDAIEYEMDRIARNLSGTHAPVNRLVPALRELCRQLEQSPAGIAVHADLSELPDLPLDTPSLHLYRIVQEAFRNISRHAHAQNATLSFRVMDHAIREVTIADDGTGLQSAPRFRQQNRIGQGLQNIADRVSLLGGSHTLHSPPSGGTRVQIYLPPRGLSLQPNRSADAV